MRWHRSALAPVVGLLVLMAAGCGPSPSEQSAGGTEPAAVTPSQPSSGTTIPGTGAPDTPSRPTGGTDSGTSDPPSEPTGSSRRPTTAQPPPGNPSCPVTAHGRSSAGWAQAIAFAPLAPREYPDTQLTLSACTSSGLPVAFTLENNAHCTLDGVTLGVSTGVSGADVPADCTVVASAAGNSTFAPQVRRRFHVGRQVIRATWGPPDISTPLSAPGKLTVHVAVRSGGSIQASVEVRSPDTAVCLTPEPAGVDESGSADVALEVSLVGPGSCTLTLSLSGAAPFVVNVPDPPRTYTVS
jgi:hypothetical protein